MSDLAPLTDAELAAHLAETAGRLLVDVRASGVFEGKALGKAGDATANEFLCKPADPATNSDSQGNAMRHAFWDKDCVDESTHGNGY